MSTKFEKSLSSLEKIVDQLEKGDLDLDAAMKLYEDGIKHANYCTKEIKTIEEKVYQLVEKEGVIDEQDFGGNNVQAELPGLL